MIAHTLKQVMSVITAIPVGKLPENGCIRLFPWGRFYTQTFYKFRADPDFMNLNAVVVLVKLVLVVVVPSGGFCVDKRVR